MFERNNPQNKNTYEKIASYVTHDLRIMSRWQLRHALDSLRGIKSSLLTMCPRLLVQGFFFPSSDSSLVILIILALK